jgi:hypothetical protein
MFFSRYRGPKRLEPALLTRISIGPSLFSISEIIWTGSESTSRTRKSVGTLEACLISASRVSSSEDVRERHATEVPAAAKARLVARPLVRSQWSRGVTCLPLPSPRPALVIKAIFPFSLLVECEGAIKGYVSL